MKRIMKGRTTISKEGRFLLSLIIVLSAISLVGIGFIITAQETQGQMLSKHIETTAIQAPVESPDILLGTFETTFYCAGFGDDGCAVCGTNGITATGTWCSPLGNEWVTIAVDPRVIPYGTRLKIVMGDWVIYGIAEDTGGFASGEFQQSKLDICCANHEEAINLGNKVAEVYELRGDFR